jgi:hypothetical protein
MINHFMKKFLAKEQNCNNVSKRITVYLLFTQNTIYSYDYIIYEMNCLLW